LLEEAKKAGHAARYGRSYQTTVTKVTTDLRSRLEELVPLQRVRVPFILHLNASFIIIEKCTLKVIWPNLEPAFCGVLVIWRANVKDSKQERLKEIKKNYGKVSLGDTTVDMVCCTVLSCP
jgi:hypothetical protein